MIVKIISEDAEYEIDAYLVKVEYAPLPNRMRRIITITVEYGNTKYISLNRDSVLETDKKSYRVGHVEDIVHVIDKFQKI